MPRLSGNGIRGIKDKVESIYVALFGMWLVRRGWKRTYFTKACGGLDKWEWISPKNNVYESTLQAIKIQKIWNKIDAEVKEEPKFMPERYKSQQWMES